MTTFFRVLMSVFVAMTSISAFAYNAGPVFSQYREEVRSMTIKDHKPLTSYRKKSRRAILQKVDLKRDEHGYFVKDVYCNITYRKKVGPGQMPNANFLNIEHTWPQSRMTRKGKKPNKIQRADLHNLFPTDSNANSTRGSYHFSNLPDGNFVRSNCQSSKVGVSSESSSRSFEPPEHHKGNVARALFYFAVRYGKKIPAHEEMFLRQWHLLDPVDEEELARNQRIAKIQGNLNPFIEDESLVNLIENF